eukprot:scaffold37028_cov57-Attheya_sp.AAC.13
MVNIPVGDFLWMSYPLSYSVVRHEIGHNFGHFHHHSNKYYLRDPEGIGGGGWHDGFDMMSGGNGFPISHLSVASKWFFNWVPSWAIVLMAPEGSTNACPKCQASGKFIIKAFDDVNQPPTPGDVMGIHIPILAKDSTVYSYWLSYRAKNDALIGLSVHLTWFVMGDTFGSSVDSLNYDAFGNTDTVFDSFVRPGTCYVVTPSLKLMEFKVSNDIQPVLCVDSIKEGENITVSVSFFEPETPPTPQVKIGEQVELECFESPVPVITPVDLSTYSMLHLSGTGSNGVVTLSFSCPDILSNETMTALFYDTYPSSTVFYGSPSAYGSYQSISVTAEECCSPGSTIKAVGGKVVKVTSSSEFLHLNEIQIYDALGNNIALDGRCFSRSSGWDYRRDCLNDNITAQYMDTCNYHVSWRDPERYEFCVLDMAVDIASITIYPWHSPVAGTRESGSISNLQIEIFASFRDSSTIDNHRLENGQSIMHGLLKNFSMGFSSGETTPKTFSGEKNPSKSKAFLILV